VGGGGGGGGGGSGAGFKTLGGGGVIWWAGGENLRMRLCPIGDGEIKEVGTDERQGGREMEEREGGGVVTYLAKVCSRRKK